MIREPFEVDVMANLFQYPGFTNTGQTGDADQRHAGRRALQFVDQETAHRLVSAHDQRVIDPRIAQPLLRRA